MIGAKPSFGSQRNRGPRREPEKKEWIPSTELGRMVKGEKIDSLDTIWRQGKVIKEAEIVDFFLPGIEERILKIGKGKRPFSWVQRMTDSGRRSKYVVAAAVGNKDGYVGVGVGNSKEYGTAISGAIRRAKLNITKVERGCGSWGCGCGNDHSIKTGAEGKSGSIYIKLMPAPQGTGITANDIAKDLLELGGVKDVWSFTKGHTSSRINTAFATLKAIKQLSTIKGLKLSTTKKKPVEEPKAEVEKAEAAKAEESKK